eukprot:TRINITY_DN3176_c1_g2_i1.p1 TRINITY_DN3176_c1_g2~~TRINITY_DN3176_c1_g2_i1.p1  ORF type:complete len:238 (+),score=37.79 TRINITY_DN3176_c1_g2_i1:30-743(+)
MAHREKYNTWADHTTGVQPFVPIVLPKRSILSYLFGAVLVIIRLPLILVLLVLLGLLSFVNSIIIIPPVHRVFRRFYEVIIARSILYLLGFWSIDTKYVNSRKKNKKPTGIPGNNFGNQDVIVCNHSSYVELFYLAFRFSPIFTAVPNNWDEDNEDPPMNLALKRNLFGALLDIINNREIYDDTCTDIDNIIGKSNAPVVVFPEGTTTNGKILIQCVPVLEGIDPERIHVVGFRCVW